MFSAYSGYLHLTLCGIVLLIAGVYPVFAADSVRLKGKKLIFAARIEKKESGAPAKC